MSSLEGPTKEGPYVLSV